MSDHGVKALAGLPPEDIEKLASQHMLEVHRSYFGKRDESFSFFNEFGAHVLYLLELRRQKKELKFPPESAPKR